MASMLDFKHLKEFPHDSIYNQVQNSGMWWWLGVINRCIFHCVPLCVVNLCIFRRVASIPLVLINPSSSTPASPRRRRRCACLPEWPWRWASQRRARCGCPPWPSEAVAVRDCSPPRAAGQRSTWGCGGAPHGHRDLLSEAGRRGKEGQSREEGANYGVESTLRKGETKNKIIDKKSKQLETQGKYYLIVEYKY